MGDRDLFACASVRLDFDALIPFEQQQKALKVSNVFRRGRGVYIYKSVQGGNAASAAAAPRTHRVGTTTSPAAAPVIVEGTTMRPDSLHRHLTHGRPLSLISRRTKHRHAHRAALLNNNRRAGNKPKGASLLNKIAIDLLHRDSAGDCDERGGAKNQHSALWCRPHRNS